jgi:hypothetical protein
MRCMRQQTLIPGVPTRARTRVAKNDYFRLENFDFVGIAGARAARHCALSLKSASSVF